MSLFQISTIDELSGVAKKVTTPKVSPPKLNAGTNPSSIKHMLDTISEEVLKYFKDSPAILITSKEQLHEYVTNFLEAGIGGIDTETTGLDRFADHIVGASLFYPGGVECYIPMKHIIPIFEEPYKNQLTYDDVAEEFKRLANGKTKLIFANADFDLSMIYTSLGVDLSDSVFYDVQIAWKCIYGNEPSNALKILYNKYVLGGKGDPKKFNDFFSPQLYPYCKPEVAKLYAANDAKITYELYQWQLPYCTETSDVCKKYHLEAVSKLIWEVEFPMIKECFNLWKNGLYFDSNINSKLLNKYKPIVEAEQLATTQMVKDILEANPGYERKLGKRKLFVDYKDFNPMSPDQVATLLYDIMGVKKPIIHGKESRATSKEVLKDLNLPITKQILKYRGAVKLVNDFIEKPRDIVQADHRVHSQFNQLGADTGRMSSEKPNIQQIPSHAKDIRHMFRATPGYVMISSDYSAQEPRIASYVSQDKGMIQAFKEDKDIYSAIASMSFNLPYEQCLENNPETGEYQPDGYKRRNEAKKIVLGVLYGRSVPSIAEQLYGDDKTMSDKQKTAKAQQVYDAVLNSFTGLKHLMSAARNSATKLGYTETILGRRKYLPDLQLPEFTFTPMSGYVNPDVDPMDVSTFNENNEIPQRVIKDSLARLQKCRYNGERYAIIEQLYNSGIQTTDNRKKIQDSVRQVVNGIVQGCLGGDTLIQTKELGIVKISDVVGQTLHLWDGDDWTLGTVTYSGKKQKCVVKLTGGLSIVCSPTHKFLVRNTRGNDKFVECRELLDGEHHSTPSRIVINSKYPTSDCVCSSDGLCCVESVTHNIHDFHLSDVLVEDKHNSGACSSVSSVTITDEYIDMYDVCNTDRGYFVANGMITHNSAADQTKMAMLRLSNTKRWHEIGGRLIIQVHDELIAEVPIEHWKEGGEILSKSMKDAASYLPFPSKCDVTTTIRWNGLEFPCPYKKPNSANLNDLSEDEIKWLQYHLAEMEYTLPVLDKDARGDASRGVNGQITEVMESALEDYKSVYNVDDYTIIDHIEKNVIYGGNDQ